MEDSTVSDAQDFTDPGGELSTEVAPDGGTTGDEQITETPEAPRQYFELDDDVAQRYVKVKVDGEELEVPLSEALSGYSRTADYTRKTQSLAQQRAEAEYALTLQRALQAAPEDTLNLLARQLGVQLGPAAAPQTQATEPEFDEFADPLERKLSTLEQRLQQYDEREQRDAANRQLQSAIGGLQSRYQADDATVREVVTQALQVGAGPGQFEMIYKNIMFDRQQQARAQYEQNNQQQEQQRTIAKEQVGRVVGTGGSAAGAGAPPPSKTTFNSYREGIEAAFDQLGA